MKKRYLILGVVLMIIPILLSCMPSGGGQQAPVSTAYDKTQDAKYTQMNESITSLKASITTLDKKVTDLGSPADASGKITDLTAKVTALQTELAAAKADATDAKNKVVALETKVNQWTNPTQYPTQPNIPTTVPTGVVSYQITNPQSYYQFPSTGGIFAFKIFNNTSISRYIRPQISLASFGISNAGTMSAYSGSANAAPAICTIQSSSLGQGAVNFQFIATPSGNVTSILFIANGGGAFGNGEYLLGPGQAMDVYANIALTTGTSALWSVTVSGADRPIQ